ncbi:hypothetical protein [Aquimarina aggregata]|uniref:hypothetical protein n=1 Tax=Aquimarina aggregata TaxID=1642818 RepID=UPI00248F6D1E|nr:hypothetical protein [Aquimarina aggregata]
MNYTIATSWNELNTWQLSKVSKLIFTKVSSDVLKYRLVYILFMIRPGLIHTLKVFYLLISVPLSELYVYAKFMVETSDLTHFPKTLTYRGKKLYGPEARLSNITIDQFSFADVFYYRWCKTRDDSDLNRLISVLYFPKGKGFSREEKNLRHSSIVKKMPMGIKLTVLMAYMGSRSVLAASFKNVFPKKKGDSKAEYSSFDKILYNMALSENQPFGHLYATKQAKLYDFMNVLDLDLANQKELKAKYGN